MTRSPLFLAALASSAVPGLDPASVAGVPVRAGDPYEVAHITDSQDRRWVIKAPRTQAAGATLEGITSLSTLVGRRLDVAIPMVRGHVVVPEGRAVVYPRVPGRPLRFARLPAGPGLAGEVGRVLAHIHNVDIALMEEADRPVYDAQTHRSRRLTELDRAAATGHVPTGLLARWERSLEDVSLWRFAPTAVHGTFIGDNVLAVFDDESDAATGHVRGVLAWEQSRVADPADDLAALVAQAPPAALDAVLEAYAQSRLERPDANLVTRGRLAAEMSGVTRLLAALAAGELALVERVADELRSLDERTYAEEETRAREVAAQRARAEADRARRQTEADQHAAARQALPDDATAPHDPFPARARADEPADDHVDDRADHRADHRADDHADDHAHDQAREQAREATTVLAPRRPGPQPPGAATQDAADRAPADDGPPSAPDRDTTGGGAGETAVQPAAVEFEERDAEDGEGGVLDLHEGASAFVPVKPSRGDTSKPA